MGKLKNGMATFRIRRPESGGIVVTVQVCETLVRAFHQQTGGALETQNVSPDGQRGASAESVTYQYAYGVTPITAGRNSFRDGTLCNLILSPKAGEEDGYTITMPISRSREQIQKAVGEVRSFLTEYYEHQVKPFEMSVTVTAKGAFEPEAVATTTEQGIVV